MITSIASLQVKIGIISNTNDQLLICGRQDSRHSMFKRELMTSEALLLN